MYFMFYTYDWFITLNVSHFVEHILYLGCTSIAVTSYASNFFIYLMGNTTFRRAFFCRDVSTGRRSLSATSSTEGSVGKKTAGEFGQIYQSTSYRYKRGSLLGKPATCTISHVTKERSVKRLASSSSKCATVTYLPILSSQSGPVVQSQNPSSRRYPEPQQQKLSSRCDPESQSLRSTNKCVPVTHSPMSSIPEPATRTLSSCGRVERSLTDAEIVNVLTTVV